MILKATTLELTLKASNNRPAGFDYLRVILSLGIVAWHTILVCYGKAVEDEAWSGPARALIFFLVPSFFALSGFLVAGSLIRNNLPSFLTLRAIRIYPALAIETFISAILIGPFLSTLSFSEYFSHSEFQTYALNVLGYVHYHLPGVFLDNPGGRSVNEQLWTIPYELECYIAIAAMALIGLTKRPKALFWTLCLATVGILAYQIYLSKFPPLSARPPGRMIVLAFLFGAALYFLKSIVPMSKVLFVTAVAACWAIFQFAEANYLAPLPVAYVTIYLGSLNPPRGIVTKLADYSYGLYLYGFPVQQTLVNVFPSTAQWYYNLPLSIAAAGALSYVSWHLVEKPVMDKKSSILAVVNRWASRDGAKLRQT